MKDTRFMLSCDICNKIPKSYNIFDLINNEYRIVWTITNSWMLPEIICRECFENKREFIKSCSEAKLLGREE